MDGAWPFDDAPERPEPNKINGTPPHEEYEPLAGILSAGVHQIDGGEYHRDPCPTPSLSSTLAKTLLLQTPLHAWHASPRLNPEWMPTDSKTFDIGRAAHRAVLGAGGDYAEIPATILSDDGGVRSKEAKAYVECLRSEGKTPLKPWEIEQIETMAEKARAILQALGDDLDPARSEMVAIAQIDGIYCRAMLDNVPLDARRPIYDFKTCENANPLAVQRAIVNYGYDVQAEHYRQVWLAATGEDRPFRFIFQEKSAPHEVCVVELGEDSLMLARRKIARAREIWRLCLERDQWPGYPLGVHRVDLPAWAMAQWLERESAEADHKKQTGSDVFITAMQMQAPL